MIHARTPGVCSVTVCVGSVPNKLSRIVLRYDRWSLLTLPVSFSILEPSCSFMQISQDGSPNRILLLETSAKLTWLVLVRGTDRVVHFVWSHLLFLPLSYKSDPTFKSGKSKNLERDVASNDAGNHYIKAPLTAIMWLL